MKSIPTLQVACGLAAAAMFVGPAMAKDDTRGGQVNSTRASGQASVTLAPERITNGLDSVIGRELLGADNVPLGTVEDLAFDGGSGRIALAVVSSGGTLGIGEKLRVLPFKAIDRRQGDDRLVSQIQAHEWESLPLIDEKDYSQGRVDRLTHQRLHDDSMQAEFFDNFHINEDRTDFANRMVLATRLRGKTLTANGREFAEIEDILVDLENDRASLLIDSDSDFTGSDRKFVAALGALQLSGRPLPETINSRLTRADFQQAQRRVSATARSAGEAEGSPAGFADQADQAAVSGSVTAISTGTAAIVGDEGISATGNEAVAGRPNTDRTLQSAVTTIRQRWDEDRRLTQANIQVTVEEGKLVLTGTVPDEDLRERAEDVADDAVDVDFENRIKIYDR